jgi:hypothetical protein
MSSGENDLVTVGDAAKILDCPQHQIRRTVDRLWPEIQRAGRARLIPRKNLCKLATEISLRFRSHREVAQ